MLGRERIVAYCDWCSFSEDPPKGESFAGGVALYVAVIVTAMKGTVAVVVESPGFARICTSPVQPAKCAPAWRRVGTYGDQSCQLHSAAGVPFSTVNETVVGSLGTGVASSP